MSERMTEPEARDAIIESARWVAEYWAEQGKDGRPLKRTIEGAIFTFLAELDGCGGLPPCDIAVLHCDKETGDVIGETRVSTALHEFFYPKDTTADRGNLTGAE